MNNFILIVKYISLTILIFIVFHSSAQYEMDTSAVQRVNIKVSSDSTTQHHLACFSYYANADSCEDLIRSNGGEDFRHLFTSRDSSITIYSYDSNRLLINYHESDDERIDCKGIIQGTQDDLGLLVYFSRDLTNDKKCYKSVLLFDVPIDFTSKCRTKAMLNIEEESIKEFIIED